MANLLPRLFVLKSNHDNGYLGYVNEVAALKGYLHSGTVDAVSPKAKFVVELATKDGNEGLVHVRSAYSNKYWTAKPAAAGDKIWIVATADKPEEDRTKASCTLFEPLIVQSSSSDGRGDYLNSSIIRLRYVQPDGKRYLRILTDGDIEASLCAQSETPDDTADSWDLFTVIDRETLLILPKYVAFKADNGKYLNAGDDNVLHFSETDNGDPDVRFEVVPNNDGTIRLKHGDLYFHYVYHAAVGGVNCILLQPFEDIPSQRFWAIKLSDKDDDEESLKNNVIALRNLHNDMMCSRFSWPSPKYTDIFVPDTPSVFNAARLEVEEPVLRRAIYNVDFRLEDARVYNLVPITLVSQILTNETSDPSTARLKLSYTKTTSSTWEVGVSVTLGIKCTVTAGIPFISEANIELSAEVTGSFKYARTTETSETVTEEYETVVPPMTVVTVSKLATRGSCDVPFSYVMRDTLYDGRTVTSHREGGIYSGINCYQFYTKKSQVPLAATRPAPSASP